MVYQCDETFYYISWNHIINPSFSTHCNQINGRSYASITYLVQSAGIGLRIQRTDKIIFVFCNLATELFMVYFSCRVQIENIMLIAIADMKIRFNPKSVQIEFENLLEQTTFKRYYPIPQNTQMEIKIDFVNSISRRKRPDVRLSYIKLSWNGSLVSTMLLDQCH